MSGAVADVRDVLGIDATALEPRQPPLKKQRTVEKRPDGITRELYALLGENAPPVAVVEHRFKDKPKFVGPVAPWREQRFRNPARADALELRHWVRQNPGQQQQQQPAPDDAMDTDAADAAVAPPADPPQLDYQFAKFNIKMTILQYTDAEYDAVLRDDDWSRAETDYLFKLIQEHDLRWVIIADRYEFPGGSKDRSMEDMKARYYSVCRNVMEMRTPVSMMSAEESQLYHAMHYNKEQEVERKRIVQMQLYRTPAEIEHEQHLIAELRRIHDSHQQLLEEREELFNRLDYPQSTGSIAAYQGSQGLATLATTIMNSDKNKKRKSIAAPSGQPEKDDVKPVATAASPTAPSRAGSIIEPARGGGHGHQRTESTASATGPTPLKDKNKSNIKQLSKAEETTYNVSHHDKLQPGVFFRTMKMNLPKANSFMTKSPAVMAELGIALNLTMPTAKTCGKYEQLAKEIAALMELRKQIEKVDQETRVFKAQEGMAESRAKRSASVLSDVSRSSKRPKKEK